MRHCRARVYSMDVDGPRSRIEIDFDAQEFRVYAWNGERAARVLSDELNALLQFVQFAVTRDSKPWRENDTVKSAPSATEARTE